MRTFILISLSILIIIVSAFQKKEIYGQYEIIKIDSINSYYLIFAKHQDSLFKIVSKKVNHSYCEKIEKGKRYSFNIYPVFANKILIGNKSVEPPLNVTCQGFDDSTSICIDRKNGIYDLFLTQDLSGLCLINSK